MTMKSNAMFRVPLAWDPAGVLTWPESADRETAYSCPACAAPVILRRGPKVSAHFAHKVAQNCNAETVVHKCAKLLIAESVQNWIAGRAPSPTLVLNCSICGQPNTRELPAPVKEVRLEHRLASGHVADVALLAESGVTLVVEIRVSHAVEDDKARALDAPFVELDGYELTGAQPRRRVRGSAVPRPPTTPTTWAPIQDNLSELHCPACQERLTRFQRKLGAVAAACGLEIPAAYYRPGICSCWSCKKEIVVFAWPESEQYEKNAPEAEPRPLTVQHRATSMSGTAYWLSVCPFCGAVQGNHYVYSDPDGPFFNIQSYAEGLRPTYQQDMLRIAFWAEYNGVI